MKRKWWIILAAVLVFAALMLCMYPVRLWLAPRWMVSRALGDVLAKLETRFADSPVQLIAPALDPEGRQKAELQLETELEHLGVVRYDMDLQTQLTPCRIKATGTVIAGGKALDLSLYLDENFAAVSSRELVEGIYYGITYDSFSQDIRSRELLAALIGEKTISEWENSVLKLDDAFSRDITLPEFTAEDIRAVLYGALALKPQVSMEHTPAGAAEYTPAVTFRATGAEIAEVAEAYRQNLSAELDGVIEEWTRDPLTVIEVQFYLHKGALVEIHMKVESSSGTLIIFACPGSNPETEPLSIDMQVQAGEAYSIASLTIETVSDGGTYREKLSLTQSSSGVRNKYSLNYTYDLSSREMDLTFLHNDRTAALTLNLAGEGDTLTIMSQDIAPLLNLFLEKPMKVPVICTLNLCAGSWVSVPQYSNLDQWSVEDLFSLLTGLGGLLGLPLP